VVANIQALVLLQYFISKLFKLTLLKHRGFLYFPIINGFNLCDPSELTHKAIESLSLFFLRPESL
jgi:hypothetical protein